MYHFDVVVTQAINVLAGKNPVVDFLMIWVSALGVPILVLAVVMQWWREDNRSHVRHILVASGLSFLLGLTLNQFILLFVDRVRPYDAGVTHLLIAPSADPSFPSDHATAVAAIAAAFLIHGMRRTGIMFLAPATLIVVSRVFVGTHYSSDVVGGVLTGICASLLVRSIYREGTKIDRFLTHIL